MDDQLRGITGDILLEAGTNEFEVLVFRLGERQFGVNVAKVREVIPPRSTLDVPFKHESVVGLFELRGSVLTLINLREHLGIKALSSENDTRSDLEREGSVIVTEFNGVRIGFLVDSVERIHRMSWKHMLPLPKVQFGAGAVDEHGESEEVVSACTGVLNLDGVLTLMVDFESVADAILMERKFEGRKVDNEMNVERGSKRVIIAEDSPFMRNQIRKTMLASGYVRAELYADGQAAWEAIDKDTSPIDAIISDIEMPRMDGLYLTKLIKKDERFANVPVVLFSSLISEDNANKGQQVGANVQIPKPELPEMVKLVDQLVSGQMPESTDVRKIDRLAA